MDKKAATTIAKNPDAKPEQLGSAAGVGPAIARLLTKHAKEGAV